MAGLRAASSVLDRLGLLTQAQRGVRAGCSLAAVNVIDSRDAFVRDMKKTVAVDNARGERKPAVVNIQRFKDDPTIIASRDYAVNIRRVFPRR
ncbi:MAG: hypothetical protein U1F20_04660 [Lysobacterales bacterium]